MKMNEEISSDSDTLETAFPTFQDVSDISSPDEEEKEEKKIRLAKQYLQDMTAKNITNINGEEVADKYSSFEVNNVVSLKCKQHSTTVTAMCISENNKYIFTGSKNGFIVKWSLEERCKISHTLVHSRKAILCVATSTDLKYLAVGNESNDIQIYNPDDFKRIQSLKGHNSEVTGLTFLKYTHTLYSASKDKLIKAWSLDEMALIETLLGHINSITSIDILLTERVLTAGGQDKSIRLWKIPEETQIIFNSSHGGNVDCVKTINNQTFISGCDQGTISIWSVNRKKPLCQVKNAHGFDAKKQPFWIVSLAVLINTDLFASGSSDGNVNIWKLSVDHRMVVKKFAVNLNGFVNSMAFLNDRLVCAVGKEHRFGRWNVINEAMNCIAVIPLVKVE